jgi:hypothetical protein
MEAIALHNATHTLNVVMPLDGDHALGHEVSDLYIHLSLGSF